MSGLYRNGCRAVTNSVAYNPSSTAFMSTTGHKAVNCGALPFSKTGSPGQIRTADLRFRKPLLYPSELRGHALESIRNHQASFCTAQLLRTNCVLDSSKTADSCWIFAISTDRAAVCATSALLDCSAELAIVGLHPLGRRQEVLNVADRRLRNLIFFDNELEQQAHVCRPRRAER